MAVDVAMLEHLVRLGVTAVELLPVHQFVHDRAFAARGLRIYWGYQSIGFFAPHNEYGSVEGFKAMVMALHGAGLEVILDVVFNHTAEGAKDGPTLCFRGLDDGAYYRLRDDGSYGTTPAAAHPRHAPAPRAAARDGLAALLGARDARRRLPP
jgi:isoamylase